MYGNDGCFGTVTARVWIFIAFLINFGSLISSIWIFVAHYVNVPGIRMKRVNFKSLTAINFFQNLKKDQIGPGSQFFFRIFSYS